MCITILVIIWLISGALLIRSLHPIKSRTVRVMIMLTGLLGWCVCLIILITGFTWMLLAEIFEPIWNGEHTEND